MLCCSVPWGSWLLRGLWWWGRSFCPRLFAEVGTGKLWPPWEQLLNPPCTETEWLGSRFWTEPATGGMCNSRFLQQRLELRFSGHACDKTETELVFNKWQDDLRCELISATVFQQMAGEWKVLFFCHHFDAVWDARKLAKRFASFCGLCSSF